MDSTQDKPADGEEEMETKPVSGRDVRNVDSNKHTHDKARRIALKKKPAVAFARKI